MPIARHIRRCCSGDSRNQPRWVTSAYIWVLAEARVLAKWFFSSDNSTGLAVANNPSRMVCSYCASGSPPRCGASRVSRQSVRLNSPPEDTSSIRR